MSYAIISLGGKQYRVREGERLLVDRLRLDESKTFHPDVLLVAGDGGVEIAPKDVRVTARVVGHVLGKKVRIGKYRKRTGYRRHTGFRSRLSQIEIESIGAKAVRAAKPKAAEAAEEQPEAAAKPRAAKPKTEGAAAAKPRAAAKKPPAEKTED